MIRVRTMTAADVPLGMRLKQEAGWNQLEADWLRFLALEPEGAFVAELDAAPVGTALTVRFGGVAWVAMVLVAAGARRQGVGTALMERALAFLDARGVETVRLDATPLGRPVYARLGFVEEYRLTRHEGILPAAPAPLSVRPATRAHLDRMLRLDHSATGTDRARAILRLFEENPETARVVEEGGEVTGYLLTRPGAQARFLGPCVARGDAGRWLLTDACHRHAGERVFLDVPELNRPAQEEAAAIGLAPQRSLLRMYRGRKVEEKLDELWASSGPEKG
jgi:predicted N-acetyltransferase YhbS